MKQGYLIIIFAFLITACKNSPAIPSNILSQTKMEEVLWDITRADLFLADYRFRKDTTLDRRTESIRLYQEIFNLHHISKEDFQRSFDFYRAHPVLFRPVMDSITGHSRDAATGLAKPGPRPDSMASILHRYGQDTSSLRKLKHKVVH